MDTRALADAIAEDRRAGVLPFCVVATVGSTSCTSIDPVPAIAEICEREGLWLHVDAAHGGAAAVVPEMRHVLDGCDRADSIVVNPHKWLFVQMGLSALYTRNPEMLRRAFSLVPEYLRTSQGDHVVNFMDYGIPLGRGFKALKLWFTLRYFGVEGLAARIREHLRLAQAFAKQVDEHTDFERLAPTPLSTICFRAHPRGLDDEAALDALNENLLQAINQTGEAFLSHTRLRGRFTIRLVVSHLRTNAEQIDRVWTIAREKLRSM
jgi:aromatic-L-amino-acid decarboxylase